MTHYTTYPVNVTQEFIDAGKVKDCDFCPVALAIKAATPFRIAAVNKVSVWLSQTIPPVMEPAMPYCTQVELPVKVQSFILRYDEGHKVKPFTFLLRVRES